jgi:hypothetical protein
MAAMIYFRELFRHSLKNSEGNHKELQLEGRPRFEYGTFYLHHRYTVQTGAHLQVKICIKWVTVMKSGTLGFHGTHFAIY